MYHLSGFYKCRGRRRKDDPACEMIPAGLAAWRYAQRPETGNKISHAHKLPSFEGKPVGHWLLIWEEKHRQASLPQIQDPVHQIHWSYVGKPDPWANVGSRSPTIAAEEADLAGKPIVVKFAAGPRLGMGQS